MGSRVQVLTSSSSFLVFVAFFLAMAQVSLASLEVGFYGDSCPSAEAIVKESVRKAVAMDQGSAAGLIRMHFHDCFVRGCDASVLIDSTPNNTAEKDSPINNPSLRGFEVIDEAKGAVEAQCPGTVSCADIIAFAARDAACMTGGIDYPVLAGRRDGRISIASEVAQNNPSPLFNADQLRDTFARKGLSLDEMVTLSGAHSIGRTHCNPLAKRLYNFSATNSQDPSIDPGFAAYLKARCPPSALNLSDPTVIPLADPDTILDNHYYKGLMNHRGVLTSDQTLWDSSSTAKMVADDAMLPWMWAAKFGRAMMRMGSIEVLTGSQGEIRTNCRIIN